MSSYTEDAIARLKERGYRITTPRRNVLELLDRLQKPVSPYEIKELLEQARVRIDTVSIYRILDCLEQNGLIHRVLSIGKYRKCDLDIEDHCRLKQAEHCHHNLVCRACGAIEELHCPDLSKLERAVSEHTGFRIEGHELEFRGLCGKCA